MKRLTYYFLSFFFFLLIFSSFGDTYTPPYTASFAWGKEIGVAKTTYKANERTGYVGYYADSFAGGSTAESMVYKSFYVPTASKVMVEAKIIYTGGTVAFGFASFSGIEKVWRVDEHYYRESLDPPFGYEDVIPKIISLIGLATPGIKAAEVKEAIEILSFVNDLSTLLYAFNQLLSSGKAKETTISFSFIASPGNHSIGVGVRGNTGAFITGSAFSVTAAIVSSIKIDIASSTVSPSNPISEVILNVPGLGVVRPSTDGRSIFIQSYGPYVEYELQFGNSYQQGEVKPGQTLNIPIPHYKTFELTIARPIDGKMGWASLRENDNIFVYKTQNTSGSAAFGTNATVMNVSGLGVVKMGAPGFLVIESNFGQYIEFSLDYGSTYIQGEVKPGEKVNLPIPHYVTFNLAIARPILGKIGWLCGRENDGRLVYVTQVSSNTATFNSNKVLLDVPNLGRVVAGSPGTLIIQSNSRNYIEYSLTYGNEYIQGEVDPYNSVSIRIPHYITFNLVIARPAAKKIGWLYGRENDGIIVYLTK